MCKECGCEEGITLICPACSGRMVVVDGQAVCTVCGAERDPATVAHIHEGHPHVHEHAPGAAHGHDHAHEQPHSQQQAVSAGEFDEITQLRVLLPHWLAHNNEHLNDVRIWADTARALGQAEASALMEEALGHLEAGNAQLAAALQALAR